jgi:hypothetical protein
MLKCKDIVFLRAKGSDKLEGLSKFAVIKEYIRYYLNYGPDDPIVERPKTADNVDLGMTTVPAADKSIYDEDTLFAQAIDYFKTVRGKERPMTALLDALDYGANLQARPSMKEPEDEDKAYEDAAKKLLNAKNSKFKSLEEAIAAVKLMMGA